MSMSESESSDLSSEGRLEADEKLRVKLLGDKLLTCFLDVILISQMMFNPESEAKVEEAKAKLKRTHLNNPDQFQPEELEYEFSIDVSTDSMCMKACRDYDNGDVLMECFGVAEVTGKTLPPGKIFKTNHGFHVNGNEFANLWVRIKESCRPNCSIVSFFDYNKNFHAFLVVTSKIKSGEFFRINKTELRSEDSNQDCICGEPDCIGNPYRDHPYMCDYPGCWRKKPLGSDRTLREHKEIHNLAEIRAAIEKYEQEMEDRQQHPEVEYPVIPDPPVLPYEYRPIHICDRPGCKRGGVPFSQVRTYIRHREICGISKEERKKYSCLNKCGKKFVALRSVEAHLRSKKGCVKHLEAVQQLSQSGIIRQVDNPPRIARAGAPCFGPEAAGPVPPPSMPPPWVNPRDNVGIPELPRMTLRLRSAPEQKAVMINKRPLRTRTAPPPQEESVACSSRTLDQQPASSSSEPQAGGRYGTRSGGQSKVRYNFEVDDESDDDSTYEVGKKDAKKKKPAKKEGVNVRKPGRRQQPPDNDGAPPAAGSRM